MANDHPMSGAATDRDTPTASLRVSTDLDAVNRTATVTPVGDLDLHTTDRLSDALAAALAEGPVGRIRLDASLLRFVDSAGLRCLLSARSLAEERGVRFGVVTPSRSLRRVLEMTGLDDLVDRDA